MNKIENVAPSEIESQSFAIIEREFHDQTGLTGSEIDSDRFQVIRRVIHATGDFDFAGSLLFQDQSIGAAISSIISGQGYLHRCFNGCCRH